MYRNLFYALNAGMLVTFAAAFVVDYDTEWKKYQKEYYRKAVSAAEARGEAGKDEARSWKKRPLEIKQIIAKDLGRIDRCVTCHVGMDEYANPTLTNDFAEHPYKAHPDVPGLVKNHNFQKYGCTVCHGGQGLATTAEDAHGFVHNWEKPLLKGHLIQGSCLKCHANFETLKGAEVAAQGKNLFEKHGCMGCHAIHGVGQTVSEGLEAVSDKPFERISLYHFPKMKRDGKDIPRHEWNVQNWIIAHLTNDPMVFVPNDPHAHYNAEPISPSGMPDFSSELGHEGSAAIAAYLMSMTAEKGMMPNKYTVAGPPKTEPRFADATAHGKFVFEKWGCAGCHGLEGKQGRRNFNAMGPGQSDPEKDMDKGVVPTLTKVVGNYKAEELKNRIRDGVKPSGIVKFNHDGPQPPLYMPEWKDKIKGKELDDLVTWLLSVAEKDESSF